MKRNVVVLAGLVLALTGVVALSGIARAQVDEAAFAAADPAELGAYDGARAWHGEGDRFGAMPGDGCGTNPGERGEPGERGGPGGKMRGGLGHMGGMIEIVAEQLGLTPEELHEQLRGGSTIADIAAAQGVPLEDIVDAVMEPVAEKLAEAVAEGRLTQDEADEKLAEMSQHLAVRFAEPFEPGEGNPGFGGKRGEGLGHMGDMMGIVAAELGLELDDLMEQLKAGSSVADIATAQGVPLDDIVDAVLEPIAEKLAETVADGKLTQEEADEKLAEMKEHLTERFAESFVPGEGNPGRGGMRRPGRGR